MRKFAIAGAAVLGIYAYRRWVLQGDWTPVPPDAGPSGGLSETPQGAVVLLFLDGEAISREIAGIARDN